jgi:hypothetical protein
LGLLLQILSQDLNKKETPIRLDFKAKFFPESVNDELTDRVVQRLFWKQIKTGVVNNDIYCPPELCVLFAAQSMQVCVSCRPRPHLLDACYLATHQAHARCRDVRMVANGMVIGTGTVVWNCGTLAERPTDRQGTSLSLHFRVNTETTALPTTAPAR